MSQSHDKKTTDAAKQPTDQKTTINKMPESMVHLFLIDIGKLLTVDKHFPAYEAHEKKGYGQALLSGYIDAFKKPATRKLSHELIHSIQRNALKHELEEKYLGTYRNEGANVPVLFNEQKGHPSPSATYQGLVEFVSTWIKDPAQSTHSLTISNLKIGKDFCIWVKNGKFEVTITEMDFEDGGLTATTKPFELEDLNMFRKVMNDPSYLFNINCGDSDLIKAYGLNYKAVTTKSMQAIFDSYEKQIAAAKTDDDKLRVIVNHVQLIDQEHPFRDGNIRACYILMNKLAHDEGLPLMLLVEPNRLDLFDKEKLFKTAKQGQQAYLMLTQGKIPVYDDPDLKYIHKKVYEIKPEKISVPDAIIKSFMTEVIEKNLQKLQQKKPSLTASATFFQGANTESKEYVMQQYHKATALYKKDQKYDATAAIKLLTDVMPQFERLFDAKATAKAYSTLASFYRDAGNIPDAQTSIETALILYESIGLKNDDPDVKNVLKKQKELAVPKQQSSLQKPG